MSQFSRVKKNQDLYSDIIQDDKTEIIDSSLKDYQRRISKDESEETEYVASRLKRNETMLEQIEPMDVELKSDYKEEILSDRDLLSDFIEEVKHYNINKGLRSVQDTQTNILNNLSQSRDQKPASSESQSILELTSEIQQIIGDLDDMELEDDIEEVEVPVIQTLDQTEDHELQSIFNEIETSSISLQEILNSGNIEPSDVEKIKEPIKEVIEEKTVVEHKQEVPVNPKVQEFVKTLEDEQTDKKSDFKANELSELTQTLSLKLDLQEKELEDVQTQSTFVDKMLTVVIAVLVIAMIAIIIYGIWWVYTERGF